MIKDLKPNLPIDDKFLIERVNQGLASNGSAYLTITLKDKTGTIEARLWSAQPKDVVAIQSGGIMHVQGVAIEYKDNLQLKISSYEIVPLQEEDVDLFVQAAPIDKDVMAQQLNDFVSEIKNLSWKKIVVELLKQHQKRFLISPAAMKHHHNVRSGLLWHTLTMLQTAKAICEVYADRNINKSLLYAGIILHDMGKTKELHGQLTVEYSLQGKLIGHISIMAGEIATVGTQLNLPIEEVILLQHMVLASHGKNEFGSPVLPQIMEAEILHHIDNLDARIYAIANGLDKIEDNCFTSRISGLENRSFFSHQID